MLLVVWFILNQTTFGCQGVLIAVKRFDLLFRFCLLSNQELFLLWGQITPTQLILADPCQCFITVRKFSLDDFKRNKWIFLKDLIARVSVNNVAVPSNDRIQHTLFLEDVHFQLVFFFKCRRIDLTLELRVDFELAQFCHRQIILSEMILSVVILFTPFSLYGVPAPFRRRFPARLWHHRRVFHTDGHSVLKVHGISIPYPFAAEQELLVPVLRSFFGF